MIKIKRVWFVSHYSMPPEYEMRIKTQMYAHYLGQKGIDCTIFSASTIHNTNINLIRSGVLYNAQQYEDLKFVHVRCSHYADNGYKRIKNMLQFSRRFRKIAVEFPFPDVVVSDVNCINYAAVYSFCRSKNIPMIVDIRDLWPLSIVEYYRFSDAHPLIRYLYQRERRMYRRVDSIVFSMEGGRDYIKEKGWDKESGGPVDLSKVHYINNGVDLEAFDRNCVENPYSNAMLEDTSVFKVVYTGSVRRANNIDLVLDAAKLLIDTNVRFIIVGDGTERERLIQRCQDERIANVAFLGYVEKRFVPSILGKADLNFFVLEDSDLFRFGLSLNKSFDYLAAGKPLLIVGRAAYSMVDKYQCGVHVQSTNAKDFADAVLCIKNQSKDEYQAMCENARRAAADYDFKVLTAKLLDVIEGVR